jgi:hypothetical protein
MKMLNNFKAWFWFKTPLRRLALKLRDEVFNKPNEHRWIRKILFSPQNIPYYDFFDFYMDERMALLIVRTVATERGVAQVFKKQYPDTCIQPGCPYDGAWLKRYAAEYLGLPDDWEDQRANTQEYKDWVEKNAKAIREILERLKNENIQ